MDRAEQEFCKPNPNAPAALSRFAFLIGNWRCEASVRLANGEWQTLQATWVGRYILDGCAIADEYRMTGPSGELIVLGTNLRTYDATKQSWNMKWLNPWPPMLTRATYTSISAAGDVSPAACDRIR